jgi:lipoprotein-anchoring transpeptidase ErfK/SrfK
MPEILAYDRMPSDSFGSRALGRRRSSAARGLIVLLVVAAACTVEQPRPQPQEDKGPYLLLKLSERRVYVVENEVKQPEKGYPVAIGQPKWPTPTGRFQVNELVENPDFLAFDFNNPASKDRGHVPPGPNNPLGLRWIGFASSKSGWQVGFHGTAKTSVLGQAVSHGCVRMANPDVVEMFKRVKLGTVVVVED